MNILITGASGFLGKHLITTLQKTNFTIYALTSQKEQLQEQFPNSKVYSLVEWEEGVFPIEDIDIVVHCAFARAHKGGKAIAESLNFTTQLLNVFVENKVKAIVNISTQEVYGKEPIPWKESDANPQSVYGTAKYFSELYLKQIAEHSSTRFTNIRLAGLIGLETNDRMVNKFVQQTINGETITIADGKLLFSQLEVRDAVEALKRLLALPLEKWKMNYNLGFSKSYSIQEIAMIVQDIGQQFNYMPEIIYNPSDVVIQAEMDSSVLYEDIHWQAKYDMRKIIEEIFDYQLK